MNEVDSLPLDRCGELRKRVDPRLVLTPVKAIGPVPNQVLEIGKIRARFPAGAVGRIREPRATETLAEVVQHCVGYVDSKGLEGGHDADPSNRVEDEE